jgi:hypothetical protein
LRIIIKTWLKHKHTRLFQDIREQSKQPELQDHTILWKKGAEEGA